MISRALTKPAPSRSGFSHSIVMASRNIEQQVFSLCSRGVLVTAVPPLHSATPILVDREIEKALNIPSHTLRVTKHLPKDFYIPFDAPAHCNRAVALGRIDIDGTPFLLRPWRESEHGILQTYPLHVRVVIEKMPLHLWSVEGAESVLNKNMIVDRLDSRTFAKEDTKLFSCWVWCWSPDHIPCAHTFTVFPAGAGRAEEMHGHSPPRRPVAPPPEGLHFNALIHIEMVEDWTVVVPRSPPSRQSGLPSSSSGESPPYPAIQRYTWYLGVPDGEEPSLSDRRRLHDACRAPLLDARRDDAGDEGDCDRRRRRATPPRNDAARAAAPTSSGVGRSCRRSQNPTSHRRRGWAASPREELPPPPPLPKH